MSATTYPRSRSDQQPAKAPGNGFLGDVRTSFVRSSLKAARNPFVLAFALIQPVLFLVLFSQVFGGIARDAAPNGDYVTFLVPAIVVQVAMFTAARSGSWLVEDIENGTFEKLLVSPMNRTAIFVGKTLSEVVLITVQVLLILGLGYVLGARMATGLLGVGGILGVALVFSVWYTAYSNILGVVTGSSQATTIGANLIHFPLLFASSAFVPVDTLPGWLQSVSAVNPVTYGVDAVRTLMFGGIAWDVVGRSLVVLVALDMVLGAVAVFFLTRASSARGR
ncbi:ABC transporter permease [halophilic archaeon]|nr:ABC transporter permease [halophilic archaeon]